MAHKVPLLTGPPEPRATTTLLPTAIAIAVLTTKTAMKSASSGSLVHFTLRSPTSINTAKEKIPRIGWTAKSKSLHSTRTPSLFARIQKMQDWIITGPTTMATAAGTIHPTRPRRRAIAVSTAMPIFRATATRLPRAMPSDPIAGTLPSMANQVAILATKTISNELVLATTILHTASSPAAEPTQTIPKIQMVWRIGRRSMRSLCCTDNGLNFTPK